VIEIVDDHKTSGNENEMWSRTAGSGIQLDGARKSVEVAPPLTMEQVIIISTK